MNTLPLKTLVGYSATICLISLSLGIIPSCKRETSNSTPQKALPIEVAYPKVKNVLLSKDYPGYLKADKTIQIVARVSGTLEDCLYKGGDYVKKGNTLFRIDPKVYQQQVTEARASLNNAKSSLQYAQATYERTKQAALADAVAQIQVIQTQASYEQALAQVSKAEAALKLAEISLGYCHIQAPCNGHITLHSYDEGNYLNANELPVLATLYKDDILYAYFNVSENQFLQREQQGAIDSLLNTVEILLPALGSDEKASLDYTSPNITLSTGTLQLRAKLVNPGNQLRDGMYVIASLPYKYDTDALLIPDASIGHDQVGAFLYVVDKENRLTLRHITTGQLVQDTLRLVTSGITPQERYVTQAQLKVRAGMEIVPVMKK